MVQHELMEVLAYHQYFWFVAVDLENVYRHVLIIPLQFLNFLAVKVGQTVYQFTVMHIGLDIAPRVPTKLMRVVAQLISAHKVQVMLDLDD